MPKRSATSKDTNSESRLRKKDPPKHARKARKRMASAPAGKATATRPPAAEKRGAPSGARAVVAKGSGSTARQKRRAVAGTDPRRSVARRPLPKESQEPETGARAKFELGSRLAEPPVEHIPWGYGQNRITAMAVDPRRVYAYWEVRDDAIGAARAALGAGGKDAWLNLRVYDVSGRIFDGTNAHSYFDVKLDRDARQWFLDVSKPSSTHCVELGLKSYEGYFQKIARSGRVDFPRAEPPAAGAIEWMSVHSVTGEISPAAPGALRAPARHAPAADHTPPHPAGDWGEGDYWVVDTGALLGEVPPGGGEGHDPRLTEWIAGHGRLEWIGEHGVREWRAGGMRFEWIGPLVSTTWEAGPFPMPIEAPGVVEERLEGQVLVQRVGGRTRILYGPWQVVVRGVGGHAEGRVIAHWEVRKSWITELGFEITGETLRWVAPGRGLRPGSSELLLAGASERRFRVGSELRLAGASEVYRIGASEFRTLGASEILFLGGTEVALRGASEVRLRGASEVRLRGASERRPRAGSEVRFRGASERLRKGASERRMERAKEHQRGAKRPTGARTARAK